MPTPCFPSFAIGFRAAIFGAVAVLSACAQPATQDAYSVASNAADPTERLYAQGLAKIANLYIDPISTRYVALAGVRRLGKFDNKLSLSETPGNDARYVLALSRDGQPVEIWPLPANNSPAEWAAMLTQIITAAKRASPQLAAVPQEKIDNAVFEGAMSALDRFSRYASPEVARDRRAARNGFGGIGLVLKSSDTFVVTGVAAESPAERAGIHIDDQIVAINGNPTAGHEQSDVVHQLRGPLGSNVEVSVVRQGSAQPRVFRLTREHVMLPTVTMTRAGDVAVFRIAGFNHNTTPRLAALIREARQQTGGRLAGIVLDLRGNPGGLLDQAVEMSDLFVHDGPIVSTVGRNPASQQQFAATGGSIAPRTPVIVLVNGGSASASEIVAAALQDAGRAVVVGSSSYGKGTVQTVVRLANDGEMTLTWARLVSPAGYLLQSHGVVPTICTSELNDDDPSIEAAVQRVGSAAPGSYIEPKARAALDESGWVQLRQTCPGRPGSRPLDVKIAERLLADPRLYAAAMHAIQPTARLAGMPAGPAEGSLTATP